MENGRRFVVEAEGLSDDNIYIQSATLNGQPLDRCFIRHQEIADGGTLRFVMGPRPNLAWGVGPSAAPYSQSR